jgi:hypothetical protein
MTPLLGHFESAKSTRVHLSEAVFECLPVCTSVRASRTTRLARFSAFADFLRATANLTANSSSQIDCPYAVAYAVSMLRMVPNPMEVAWHN